jgi:hypothetical protein
MYWLLLPGGILQSVPCTVAILWSVVCPHLKYDDSWFIYQSSLVNTSSHLVAKQGETWWEMSINFAGKLSYSTGIINIP